MEIQRMQRDAQGLARTRFCLEHADGGLTVAVGRVRRDLEPEMVANGPAFAETLQELWDKRWFTPEVMVDLTFIVASNWSARAKGWRRDTAGASTAPQKQ